MAKRKLGQHFLFDGNILRKIVAAMGLHSGSSVLEIGAGPGSLTGLLLKSCGMVYSVEIDPLLFERLGEKFSGVSNLKLIHGDILDLPLDTIPADAAVGNIPYYITTPIIFKLLESGRISRFGLLMQKEVATRVVADHGGSEYGVLSVNVQAQAVARMLFTVGRKAFVPPPLVDSAFVLFEKKPVSAELRAKVRELARNAFSMRRKTLLNNLKKYYGEDSSVLLERFSLEHAVRPEEVAVDTYMKMAGFLLSKPA